jgi:hypothetical protein
MDMKKIFSYSLLLAMFLFGAGAATTNAFEVRISGDKLSVHADQVPLHRILRQLAGQGINIKIEPQLNPAVSASFNGRDIQKGLDAILKPLNHVLLWEAIEGPFGSLYKLAEIQIFRPGKKELMKPLGTKFTLSIAGNSKDGALFVKDEILIRFKPGISILEVKKLLKKLGARVVDSYPALGVYKIRLGKDADIPAVADQVASHPVVAKAEPNYVYPIFVPNKSPDSAGFVAGLSNITESVEKVPVAILDTGLDLDSGLKDVVLASLDAMNPDQSISDSIGHGTQMAFIAAGVVKPLGVNSDAAALNPIIPVRAFDDNGFTSSFHIMRSIDFAMRQGARVMSLSWGSESRSGFLENMLNLARSKGLVVVASAGNEPTGEPFYPAAYPSVIGVGALGPDGKPWKKSNYGDFVMLSAAGFAALPVGYKGDPGVYAGTSVSAAFVAGRIASHLSANPEATIDDVLNALNNQ